MSCTIITKFVIRTIPSFCLASRRRVYLSFKQEEGVCAPVLVPHWSAECPRDLERKGRNTPPVSKGGACASRGDSYLEKTRSGMSAATSAPQAVVSGPRLAGSPDPDHLPHLRGREQSQLRGCNRKGCGHFYLICLVFLLRNLTGTFPDYPDAEEGGSAVIFSNKTPQQVQTRLRQSMFIHHIP